MAFVDQPATLRRTMQKWPNVGNSVLSSGDIIGLQLLWDYSQPLTE